MKNIYRLKTFLLIFSLCAVSFSACDDDENENREVALLSFGPAGVKHGDQIKFIGTNLDKVSSIVLPPGVEIPSSSFASQSSSLIELVIPTEAEAGIVVLKTPTGDIETKTPLDFEVPVEITSMTSEVKPGTNLTITGNFLNWVEEITFADDLVVTEFVSQSLTELVVLVPMAAESGFLTFRTGGTEPLTFASDEQLTVSLPAVTAISPASVEHTKDLTLTGTNLDLVTAVVFGGGTTVSAFESQSETQIVLKVPNNAVKGKLTLKQASPVDVVTTGEVVITLPVGTDITPKPAVPGTDNVTITGTNLNLVEKLKLMGKTAAIEIPKTSFTTHTATEIVFALPADANNGGISYTSIYGYSSTLGVTVQIPGAGPPPLALSVYDEAILFGGGVWSWGGTSTSLSTEQAYTGTKSFKHTTSGSDGGASVGGMTGVDASGLAVFKFSLYGGPGTNGKQVAAILNDNWGNYNSVTLQEGKWTEYSIPLSSYPGVDKSNITRWIFKVEGANQVTLYVDRVGFDPAGPAPLDYYIYDDGLKNGWQEWNGWGHTTKDFANAEQVFKGTKAIKMTFNDQYGAVQFGSPSTGAFSGYSKLSFRVYASAAQNLIVQLNNGADKGISIPQGWSVVDLPISDLDGNASVGELRFKNNNANLPVTLYFDEIGLKL